MATPNKIAKIAVIGAGSWGTAVACLLADNNHQVRLWGRTAQHIEAMRRDRRNGRYLPLRELPPNIELCTELAAAIGGAELLVLAVPSHALRDIAGQCRKSLQPNCGIMTLVKGIEDQTFNRMSEVVAQVLPGHPCVVVTGPSLAAEVSAALPTAVVAASQDAELAHKVQQLMINKYFRVYTIDDMIGAEVGGAVKNVIAIAAGIVDGLQLGENTRATLITRGLREIITIGNHYGAKVETFYGLSGMGDLIVTCNSKLSRNHSLGELLGKGYQVGDARSKINMVTEGVKTTAAVMNMARRNKLELPIIEEVYNVLYQNKAPADSIFDLMTRQPKSESGDQFFG